MIFKLENLNIYLYVISSYSKRTGKNRYELNGPWIEILRGQISELMGGRMMHDFIDLINMIEI